jgi:hypothetical protein
MSDELVIAVVPITDENRESLKWITLAQLLDGKACIFCGFTWTSREKVLERDPVKASLDGDVACKQCWDEVGGA